MEIEMPEEDYIMHYGVKGMKWGVRRYVNEDGSYTEAGKKRYKDVPKNLKKRKYIGTKEVEELPSKQRRATERWMKDQSKHTYKVGKKLYKQMGGRKAYKKMLDDFYSGRKVDNEVFDKVDSYMEMRGRWKDPVRDIVTIGASAAGVLFVNEALRMASKRGR